MAKVIRTIKITLEIDEAEIAPRSVNVFLYQLLNRINYEHPIKGIEYKGKAKTFANPKAELPDLPLKIKDSIQ